MIKPIMVAAGTTAVVLAAAGGPAGAGASAAAAHQVPPPGAQLWAERYNGPGNGEDIGRSLALSPDGKVVFVTGAASGSPGSGYSTVAYRAGTGAVLWRSGFDGVQGFQAAVSPDGGTVIVAGITPTGSRNRGLYTTVAYAAATGAVLWEHRYTGGGTRTGSASVVAISPGGGRVFVSGTTTVSGGDSVELTTAAYRTATGARLWVQKYRSPVNLPAGVSWVRPGPDGRTVFVAGTARGHCVTVAYRAATGARLWAQRFPIRANGAWATSLAVSPGGGRVFLAGYAYGGAQGSSYITVAYRSASGTQLWHKRYGGPGRRNDYAHAMAVSPSGKTVYVTGSASTRTGDSFGTIAYNAATGAQRWVSLHSTGEFGTGRAMAVSPDGSKVFVTGDSYRAASYYDYATMAYSAATGAWLWTSRYTGPAAYSDISRAIAISPDGASVFITGTSYGSTPGGNDYVTIAYHS